MTCDVIDGVASTSEDRRVAIGRWQVTTTGSVAAGRSGAIMGDGGAVLAAALSVNALVSGVVGVALLAGAGALGGWLGLPAWMLAVAGAGLIGVAVLVLRALVIPRRLRATAIVILAADIAWILAAGVLIVVVPTALSARADVTLAVLTLAVAAIAGWEAIGLWRAGPGPLHGAIPIMARASRTIAAPAAEVWAAVADAGTYARFAEGIAATSVDGRAGGMVRHCTDDRGHGWTETCTLWQEGRRYRMTVDVTTYPLHYRALLHRLEQTWEAVPTAAGTRVTLRFDGAVKLGVIGRIAVAAMSRGGRVARILAAYDRELAGSGERV